MKKSMAHKMQPCTVCTLYNNVIAGRCADILKEQYGYSCHEYTLF